MISIIIPTYKREDVLRECVARLRRQKVDEVVEILVMEDRKHLGPAVLRNKAILKAGGEILIFINDDTMVIDGWLQRQVDFHRKNKAMGAAVGGPFVMEKSLAKGKVMTWLANESGMHFVTPKGSGWVDWSYFWTCNVSVKKEFLIGNNLFFDEDFGVAAWEDVEFGYRAGKKGLRLFYDKKLVAYHRHGFEMDDVWKRYFVHGRGLWLIGKKLPMKYLPPLARWYGRWLARLLLAVSGYRWTKDSWKKWLMTRNSLNNWIMQYLIVGEKLAGFDYENKLHLSGN